MKRAEDALLDLALRTFPAEGELAVLGGPAVLPPRIAARRVATAGGDDALELLHARARAPFDAIAVAWPTRFAPLIPFASALADALKPDGRALAMDLVWQTAPSLELLRAFAPPAGREKVRPIEGYEMQLEHAGLRVVERHDVDRTSAMGWTAEQQAAVAADARGAARVVLWALERAHDDDC